MNMNFNDLPWHDANLQFIFIDRRTPGERDIVRLLIDWPEDNKSSILEFKDCYALTANMNFGVIACESILTAECIFDSKELNFIREKWSKVGVLLDNLKCFRIETNSTNSIINIFCLNFEILDSSNEKEKF
ncbi:hypothetical protein [Candidatus Protochlamydia phocaeensis]|uniref:hypothetical protein n=1 Tax=Candidatus Protochlamydia phocaeensis TaxID=1414722 RepID=UPI0009AE74F0|nr:hypothetical protein [Candidatus Protochlamydia phocaeensis]